VTMPPRTWIELPPPAAKLPWKNELRLRDTMPPLTCQNAGLNSHASVGARSQVDGRAVRVVRFTHVHRATLPVGCVAGEAARVEAGLASFDVDCAAVPDRPVAAEHRVGNHEIARADSDRATVAVH
jgi:hypothetical protein